MDSDSPWYRDERHREQLALVVRDDLLGLARYIVNKSRVNKAKEEEEQAYLRTLRRGGSRGIHRPSTSPEEQEGPLEEAGASSSSDRPFTSPANVRLDLIPEAKALDGSSAECVACAKAITARVLKFLDSAQTRFEVAERLLLLQEAEEAEEARYELWREAKEEGRPLDEFSEEERKRFKRFRSSTASLDQYIHKIASSMERDEEKKAAEEDRFELVDGEVSRRTSQDVDSTSISDAVNTNGPSQLVGRPKTFTRPTTAEEHVGIFNPHDVKQLFEDGALDEDDEDDERNRLKRKEKYNPFVTKLYRLVAQQSEPEEAIVDVLDKVSMLLKVKKCAFPKDVLDSPKKENFIGILKNTASIDLEADVVDLFGKARDETRQASFVEPGWLCTAVMTSLSPDTTYYYTVTSDGINFSDTISFVSAPPLDDPNYNFSFIAYGDMGTWSHVKNASAAVATAKISTSQVLSGARRIDHFGDISYAKGVSGTWDAWFDLIEPYASKVPYMVTIGNHEFDYVSGGDNDPSINSINPQPAFKPDWWQSASDSGGECGVPMHNRFTMPSTPLSNGLFWYSFDFANTHTIMLSSEHNCTEGSPQYKFLESDLEGIDREKTPWVFVEFHRPMYNREDSAQYDIALGMQSEFEPILLKYEVDLVLAGHFHSYLRTSRVANDKRDEDNGIVHITVGSAGASLDASDGCSELEWTEYFTQNWGVGKVTVENSTHVKWEFIENHDDHNHGAVVDETWIIKR